MSKKYAIDEQLDLLPMVKRKKAIAALPGLLNVQYNTFRIYCNLEIGDTGDIPAEKVALLEKFFGIEPGSLRNYQVTTPTLDELIKQETAA
ncbi:hypothetical protein HQ865_01355 [Mucilaginibacter mali]|uniref:Uncharacterized protein n=1 Tax=Mucilaginibacter mali TaxID=2740462 RepID=A0A7D4UJ30_9SPHI|nr:hypothetical protein [Mucilaginibacter mali]QKJ28462.1 hypothetical protein HQ865_01355 [Mucilaginibacter mali]